MKIKTDEWSKYADFLNNLAKYYKKKFRCSMCGGQSEYINRNSLRCLNCGHIFKFQIVINRK